MLVDVESVSICKKEIGILTAPNGSAKHKTLLQSHISQKASIAFVPSKSIYISFLLCPETMQVSRNFCTRIWLLVDVILGVLSEQNKKTVSNTSYVKGLFFGLRQGRTNLGMEGEVLQ